MVLSPREKVLVPRVKQYFSGKGIHSWNESLKVRSAYGTDITIDLAARDTDDLHLLIEIKTKSGDKKLSNRKGDHRNAAFSAVGQLLDYATAYIEQHNLSIENLRLITVIEDHEETIEHSKTVEKICRFLCQYGINMQHIRI